MTAAAEAKVSGGTIVRVETDADGNAAYEAHMTKSDGKPVTVYVDKDFNVVSVDSGGPDAATFRYRVTPRWGQVFHVPT